MATNRDLLKEAIADAKAVKEMAIANAKTALEEAFTPRLKEMLSAKIQEMDKEDVDEMKYEEDDTTMDEGMHEEDDKDAMKEETSEPHGNIGAQTPEGEPLGFLEEEDDKDLDEVDLEELLAELEEEEKEDLNEAEEEDEVEDEEESEEEEGEPLDLEDMTDEDLKQMIEDVIADMIESGELEAGEGAEEEAGEEGEEMEMSDEEEEVDLTELLKEIEEEMKDEEVNEEKSDEATTAKIDKALKLEEEETISETPFPGPTEIVTIITAMAGLFAAGISFNAIKTHLQKKAKEGSEKAKKILRFISMKGTGDLPGMGESKEISELRAENKSLKSDLNEAIKETNATNLLNAKLLYSNKIFRSKNLNESQKVKVLESFDKANTVKETKLVYETLNEGLKIKKSTIKENLGRASKSTTVPTTKKPIVESNDVFARMQKLAGIIK
jgi:hypothetical protein